MDEAQMMQIAVLVKEMLEPRFQGIEKSIDSMQTTIASMQTTIASTQASIVDMNTRMEVRFQAVEASVADMNTRMETKFHAVEANIVDLQTNMASTNAKLTQPGEDDANAFIIGICNIMQPFTRFWVQLRPKLRAKID